jgi:hypothetical protein
MEIDRMKRELLDNGNIWRKGDGRWIGMVRYRDEFGVTQRKSFSAKKKKDLSAFQQSVFLPIFGREICTGFQIFRFRLYF